jgi:hypothetical protein
MLRIFARWFGWFASCSFDKSVSHLMTPARAIARRFRHEYVGTEHIWAGRVATVVGEDAIRPIAP